MTQLVILDRDGVINADSDAYIKSLDEWHLYPGAAEAIARLHQAGWQVAIATNQSGVGRGYYSVETLEAIHSALRKAVETEGGAIAAIAYCPHRPDADCSCRKPRAGLLLQIQQELALVTLANTWMVGDSLRDIQAGEIAGCRTALVKTGKGMRDLDKLYPRHSDTWVCEDLAAFVDRLLGAHSPACI